jgi:hypothetical protein
MPASLPRLCDGAARPSGAAITRLRDRMSLVCEMIHPRGVAGPARQYSRRATMTCRTARGTRQRTEPPSCPHRLMLMEGLPVGGSSMRRTRAVP